MKGTKKLKDNQFSFAKVRELELFFQHWILHPAEDFKHMWPADAFVHKMRDWLASEDRDLTTRTAGLMKTHPQPNKYPLPSSSSSFCSELPTLTARATRFTVRHCHHRNSVCISQWAILGPLVFSWNSDSQFTRVLSGWALVCLGATYRKSCEVHFRLQWKGWKKGSLAVAWMSSNQAASSVKSSSNARAFHWKRKNLHFNKELQQNYTCQSNVGLRLGEQRAVLCAQSQRCIQVCLQFSHSHTRLLHWNKGPFHTDLDTRPPPSPQEPTRGIHPDSLISISLHPWQTVWGEARGWG